MIKTTASGVNYPDSDNIPRNTGNGTTDAHKASTSSWLTVGGVVLLILIFGIVVQLYKIRRLVFLQKIFIASKVDRCTRRTENTSVQ